MFLISAEIFGEDTRTLLSLGTETEQLKGQPIILYISFSILCIYLLTLKMKIFVYDKYMNEILHSFLI